MAHEKKYLPKIWGSFGRLPSIFEESNDWFPDIMTFANDRGLSVSEDDRSVLVEAAVPGLKPENIEISLDKGTLWIKGQKSEEVKSKERNYYRKASSTYSYCTSLPEGTDVDKEPQAVCEDGIVKITFSKKASVQPKKIAIKKKK